MKKNNLTPRVSDHWQWRSLTAACQTTSWTKPAACRTILWSGRSLRRWNPPGIDSQSRSDFRRDNATTTEKQTMYVRHKRTSDYNDYPPINQSINQSTTRLASSQIVTWAYGILPLSNQQSKTSGIRFSMPFPRCDGISSLSTVSRCKSSTRTPLSCANSSIEPTHTISSPILADPQRYRRAPITTPRNWPITCLLQIPSTVHFAVKRRCNLHHEIGAAKENRRDSPSTNFQSASPSQSPAPSSFADCWPAADPRTVPLAQTNWARPCRWAACRSDSRMDSCAWSGWRARDGPALSASCWWPYRRPWRTVPWNPSLPRWRTRWNRPGRPTESHAG